MSNYEAALVLAAKAHAGQTRWNGDPYITHPMRVAARVALRAEEDELGISWVVALKQIAALHDVLEDTDVPSCDIEATVGEQVTRVVEILTRPPKEFRTNTYAQYIDVIAGTRNQMAIRVKLADLEDNMALPFGVFESNLGDPPTDKLRKRYEKAHATLSAVLETL